MGKEEAMNRARKLLYTQGDFFGAKSAGLELTAPRTRLETISSRLELRAENKNTSLMGFLFAQARFQSRQCPPPHREPSDIQVMRHNQNQKLQRTGNDLCPI